MLWGTVLASADRARHQEYYIIGVDPLGLFAYGATSSFHFVYDLNTYEIKIQNQSIVLPPPLSAYPFFVPHALGMSEHFAVVAGYAFTFELTDSVLLISDVAVPMMSAMSYTLQYDMAVDISEQNQVLIAGTFKNSSGIGPCIVCPQGRKNSGDSGIQCDWCQITSFCP
ncbi:unnamed protein product, partial [Didymodactylos carnosus]